MNLNDTKRQKTKQLELPLMDRGEALKGQRSVELSTMSHQNENSGADDLMSQVVSRENMKRALKRVQKNKGSAGVDGMSLGKLKSYLITHWREVREELLKGSYQPKPVKRVEIPKPSGGIRQLGIPSVLDRLIQQAILQVLQPLFDPLFSDQSYGFRPNRSAHQAIETARNYIAIGKTWVVDVDLENFFDRVNHDMIMGRVAKRIKDKHLLKLIRKYLEAGIMANGVVMAKRDGAPQGGPLSPLLANILLDDVDKELEKRGHFFVRYADDNNVYVGSKRAAERVMTFLTERYAKLKLKVNAKKSRVRSVWRSQFLGFSFWRAAGGAVKVRVSKKSWKKMKDKIRKLTSRTIGQSLDQVAIPVKKYLGGWKEYFQLAETPGVFATYDSWIRRRLRMIRVKQWKRGRTAFRILREAGTPLVSAATTAGMMHSWWAAANTRAVHYVMSKAYFDSLGVPQLAK
jgi:RNA-directed DNA polymerase